MELEEIFESLLVSIVLDVQYVLQHSSDGFAEDGSLTTDSTSILHQLNGLDSWQVKVKYAPRKHIISETYPQQWHQQPGVNLDSQMMKS